MKSIVVSILILLSFQSAWSSTLVCSIGSSERDLYFQLQFNDFSDTTPPEVQVFFHTTKNGRAACDQGTHQDDGFGVDLSSCRVHYSEKNPEVYYQINLYRKEGALVAGLVHHNGSFTSLRLESYPCQEGSLTP